MALFGNIDQIANTLGLNNWDLQVGSYNGVTFHMANDSALNQLQKYNPLAGPVQTAINVYKDQNAGDVFGTHTTTNSALPYGTKTVAKNFSDLAERRLVKHNVPNMEGDVFEDLGFNGESFSGVGIVFGSEYYSALYNFETYFINDNAVKTSDLHILRHPIRGVIKNTYLQSAQIQYVYNKWRACVFTFKFESENVGTVRPVSSTIANKLNQGLANAQGIATGMSQAVSDGNVLGGLL